jgi:hypothetical protein
VLPAVLALLPCSALALSDCVVQDVLGISAAGAMHDWSAAGVCLFAVVLWACVCVGWAC